MTATAARSATRCSFCMKAAADVEQLIAGPGLYICNECVAKCQQIFDAGAFGRPSTVPDIATMSDDEILAGLPRIASVAAQVEDNLRSWVQRLRDRGVSWARIGQALGMARQSAWERFAGES